MAKASIIAKNIVAKQPGGFALEAISFALNKNENLAITGASGSGKTTLAQALCGKLFITGVLEINYQENTELLSKAVLIAQRYIIKNRSNTVDGYYQQRYNSTENEDAYTVVEELKTILDNEEKIDFLLNELSILYLKEKPILQLSSGEHKRFQLIKALLNPTQLMILDEPFIGLDVESRKKLNDILSDVSTKGTQLIIIAGAHHHFPNCVTHVLELENGKQRTFTERENFEVKHRHQTHHFDSSKLPLKENDFNFSFAIKMINTSVKYGDRTILNKINWAVKKGERWLLKGHNGAGKSTLLSLAYGDNPQAYANEIYLFDRRRGTGESIWDIKKNIGFMSPELHAFFDKNISCFEAVASGYFDTMGLYKKLQELQIQNIDNWLKALDLEDLRNTRLSSISSGKQRLILLIRALIKNPPLLVLDEPCQGLDEFQTEAFIKLVDDICEKNNTTLIYISHYDNEVPNCITKILMLENGVGESLLIRKVQSVTIANYKKPSAPNKILNNN